MMRDNATATTWHSAPASECLSEIQLLRYLRDEVDEQEARVIEQHLDQHVQEDQSEIKQNLRFFSSLPVSHKHQRQRDDQPQP